MDEKLRRRPPVPRPGRLKSVTTAAIAAISVVAGVLTGVRVGLVVLVALLAAAAVAIVFRREHQALVARDREAAARDRRRARVSAKRLSEQVLRSSAAAQTAARQADRSNRALAQAVREASEHSAANAAAAKSMAGDQQEILRRLGGLERHLRKPTSEGSEPREPWKDPGWLAKLLWIGFRADATSALERVAVDDDVTPQARSRAFLELARWASADLRPEEARRLAQLVRVADPQTAGSVDQTALEVDCLIADGRPEEARKILHDPARGYESESDRLLRLANTHPSTVPPGAAPHRLEYLSEVLERGGFAPLELVDPGQPISLDNIQAVAVTESGDAMVSGPKVSVLMPAYNCEATINRALSSLLRQTWSELEVLVVDDASTDATAEAVSEVALADPRVRLIRQEHNAGPYAARNAVLAQATGELVTVHDADDWSHPQKIATLVRRLIKEPRLVAALSHHVRVLPDLTVVAPTARPLPRLIAANRSSLLFRREVFEAIGPWDDVRYGGDSELLERMESFYGKDRVDWALPEVPLSFSLASPLSLTGSPTTGFASLWHAMGARRQYQSAYQGWHASESFSTELPFVPGGRPAPFHAPALIRRVGSKTPEHFDVVMLSDFALPGGTTASNVQEIEAQARAGMRVGLLHHRPQGWNAHLAVNPKVRALVDGEGIRMLSVGEQVTCDLLTVRLPRAVERLLDELPAVEARQIVMVVNQLPRTSYGRRPSPDTYDIPTCQRSMESRFGAPVTWYPNSPVVRATLLEHHHEQLAEVTLAEQDWVNIIDVSAWRRPAPIPRGSIVTIGRHGRDVSGKWPGTADDIRAAYPDRSDVEIRVLGGASSAESLLGALPGNWVVHDFDSVPVREFLSRLDFYVYLVRNKWIEAFPRTMLEAIAVGVPVVTFPQARPTFGDAALYAEPGDVMATVDALNADPDAYQRQVDRGFEVVERTYGHDAHLRRLARLGVGRAG